jgi:hypothetical protein
MSRAVALVVVVLFGAAVARGVYCEFVDDDAPAADYVAALAGVALSPRDTLLVHPPWRTDVVAALRSTTATATEAFAPKHGERWPPLVLVRDRGHVLPAVFATRPQQRLAVSGDVEVVRVGDARGSADAAHDAFDLAGADVFVDVDGDRVPCPWVPAEQHHVCTGLPQWMKVGEESLTIAGKSERCIWAHPKTGATLVIDYGVVDVGKGVDVDVALSDVAADNRAGKGVEVDVAVGDAVGRVSVAGKRGFVRTRVAASVPEARLTLRLTTPNDGQRHLCYRVARVPS